MKGLQIALEHWRSAEGHRLNEEHDWALVDLEEAIRADPRSAELWLSKGHSLASLGRYEEAISAAAMALQLRPGWHDAYYDRACWESLNGNLERAALDLQYALEEGGIDRLTAAADSDLDPLRADSRFSDLLPDKALPADVHADAEALFLGSEWEVVFRFLNRPENPVRLDWLGTEGLPARHFRTVEDIWPESGVNAHVLRVIFKVSGEGEGRIGPWRIGASGLDRELDAVQYVFRKPPSREAPGLLPMRAEDFVVPSTHFAGLDLHKPLRRGGRVLVKTLPGEQVEWAAVDAVQHELRREGQTEWLGWQGTLPPNAKVRIRRGNKELWSGQL
jgi:hypothetical protein